MKRSVAVCLLLALLVLFCACGGRADDLLAYQTRALSMQIFYEAGGAPTEAELKFGKDGAAGDFTLTILSPGDAAGLIYTRCGDTLAATRGGVSVPLQNPGAVTFPLSFFRIPENAAVTSIEKDDEGRRTATLTDGTVVWTLTFAPRADVPATITKSENGITRTLTITALLSCQP